MSYELTKIAAISVPHGEVLFTNEDGGSEILRLHGPDPQNPSTILADRWTIHHETGECIHEVGRIDRAHSVLYETGQFAWEHRKVESEGAATVVAVTFITIAINSLYRRHKKQK
jgi:hypothetical protein